MTIYEYEILSFPMDRKDSQIGWEVVSVSSSKFANIGHTAFLKRETSGGKG